jgi:cyclic pyranopterin phosphate synthase
MPLDEYQWMNRRELLTFDEITRLTAIFARLGVTKVRLTGGEPLVRKDLHLLIERLSQIDGLDDLCLTTNGSLLAEQAGALAAAGLNRVNVSIDTLDPEKFRRMTKRGNLNQVLAGLFAAKRYGLGPIKLNAVIERGTNEDDILPLAQFARAHDFHLRFIEFLDVGNANKWSSPRVFAKREILQTIHAKLPLAGFESGRRDGPAVDYRYADGMGQVGVIASMTEPFCTNCTRARLTADGKLVTCLFSSRGHDLKALLRGGATDRELCTAIAEIWQPRIDRFSEQRLAAINSGGGYRPGEHPKLEMISLGG